MCDGRLVGVSRTFAEAPVGTVVDSILASASISVWRGAPAITAYCRFDVVKLRARNRAAWKRCSFGKGEVAALLQKLNATHNITASTL
jgi:hypothetical protein